MTSLAETTLGRRDLFRAGFAIVAGIVVTGAAEVVDAAGLEPLVFEDANSSIKAEPGSLLTKKEANLASETSFPLFDRKMIWPEMLMDSYAIPSGAGFLHVGTYQSGAKNEIVLGELGPNLKAAEFRPIFTSQARVGDPKIALDGSGLYALIVWDNARLYLDTQRHRKIRHPGSDIWATVLNLANKQVLPPTRITHSRDKQRWYPTVTWIPNLNQWVVAWGQKSSSDTTGLNWEIGGTTVSFDQQVQSGSERVLVSGPGSRVGPTLVYNPYIDRLHLGYQETHFDSLSNNAPLIPYNLWLATINPDTLAEVGRIYLAGNSKDQRIVQEGSAQFKLTSDGKLIYVAQSWDWDKARPLSVGEVDPTTGVNTQFSSTIVGLAPSINTMVDAQGREQVVLLAWRTQDEDANTSPSIMGCELYPRQEEGKKFGAVRSLDGGSGAKYGPLIINNPNAGRTFIMYDGNRNAGEGYYPLGIRLF